MRRAIAVLKFTFAPLKGGGVLNWGQAAAGLLVTAAALVGVAVPKHVGGPWLALGGFLVLGVLFFRASYQLHRVAHPEFPRHRITTTRPFVVENPAPRAQYDSKLIGLEITFYNREPERRANLDIDLDSSMSFRTKDGQTVALNPIRLMPFPGAGLGETRNIDVAPQKHVKTLSYFVASIPGLELEAGEPLIASEDFDFTLRLTDNLTGAEHRHPLVVYRPSPAESEDS